MKASISPWRSLWLSPGDTIARIVAENPRRHVLALGAVSGALEALYLLDPETLGAPLASLTQISGAAIHALAALAGALTGVANLYLSGFLLNAIARFFKGAGSPLTTRAALAWGSAPSALGSAVALLLGAFGAHGAGSGEALSFLGSTALLSFELWGWVATVAMVVRVQRLSWPRAFLAVFLVEIAAAGLIALAVRTFVFQPFNTPSRSMEPTLLQGDYFFANKFAYGYSRFSLPFAPRLFSGRVLAAEPRRGDVVVFALPREPQIVYVKRIIGLPGDRVQLIAGRLYINGEVVSRKPLTVATAEGDVPTYEETLPGGVTHLIEEEYGDAAVLDNTEVFEVPPGSYFVLGDNRDNSVDSRVRPEKKGIGYVPFENLIGRVAWIFFSLQSEEDGKGKSVRSERIGRALR
ncbi:MAG: signal peptidase I [Methylocystis sp.]